MKREARRTRVITTALTQPKPNFVSAVWAGANQLPWTALKGADAVLTLKTEELAMTLKTLKEAGVEIAQIAFAADKFADEASVSKWLADGGYGDYEIEKTDSGSFVVKSKSEFVGDMRQIEADGVTLTVGALKANVEAAEKAAAEAAPAPAPAVAVVSEDVQPVAKSEDEPAFAVIPEERVKGCLSKVMELNGLVSGLKWVISDMTYDIVYGGDAAEYQSSVGQLKAAAASMVDVMVRLFGMEAAELMAQFSMASQASADEPAAPAADEPAPAVDAAPEAPAADAGGAEAAKQDEPAAAVEGEQAPAPAAVEEEITDPVMKFMAAEFAKITKSVEGLTGQVTEVVSKQDALGARVEGLETGKPVAAPQTRKSADVDEASAGSTDQSDDAKAKSKSIGDLTLAGGLGISIQRFKGERGSRTRA